jgi:hypothetical protein
MMLADTFKQFFFRKYDPLSPVLFNIVEDMLAIMIVWAKKNDGHIARVVPHLVDGGLSILQYVDDTNIFMEDDLENKINLKLIC